MKIGIVTALRDNTSWYSVNRVIRNQVRMLVDHGHNVTVITVRNYSGHGVHRSVFKSVLPEVSNTKYNYKADLSDEDDAVVTASTQVLYNHLAGCDAVFTHDIMCLETHLPYALAVCKFSRLKPEIPFYHWVHSKGETVRDWWDLSGYPTHTLVYPNQTDLKALAGNFQIPAIKIPHSMNFEDVLGMCKQAQAVVHRYPQLAYADISQVYPVATDRMDSKGVTDLILLFSRLKKLGKSVFLFIANSYKDRSQKRLVSVDNLARVAYRNKLRINQDVVFSSEIPGEHFEMGLPNDVLLDLFKCTNLFVYPTKMESQGLVLMEAALSGRVLPVLNKDVEMMQELYGPDALYHSFKDKSKQNTEHLAVLISALMGVDIKDKFRRNMLLTYHSDAVYNSYYKPLFEEVMSG